MELDLKGYLSIICKRFTIILISTFVVTLGASVLSFFIMPEIYESNTTLFVGKQVDAVQTPLLLQDLQMGQILVKDYREIARSRTVAQKVKSELKAQNIDNPNVKKAIELSDESFSNKISVNSKNDTRIIEIKVSDVDPEACAIIANKVAEVFTEKVVELLKVENVQIIDRAEVPRNPVKPRKLVNVAIGFVLGLMTGIGIAFLIEYMDNTIKTPEDVTKYTDLTVIGVIPMFDLIEENDKS